MGPMDAEVSGFSLQLSVVLEGQVGAFVYGCGTLRLLAAAFVMPFGNPLHQVVRDINHLGY